MTSSRFYLRRALNVRSNIFRLHTSKRPLSADGHFIHTDERYPAVIVTLSATLVSSAFPADG